jgi:hypothetical protein
MNERLDNMTLRQKLSEADKLSRELIHHLEHGFIPKAHLLRRTARQGTDPTATEQGEVTDLTIRSTVETVLNSDDFSRQVSGQLVEYLESIDRDVQRIFGG